MFPESGLRSSETPAPIHQPTGGRSTLGSFGIGAAKRHLTRFGICRQNHFGKPEFTLF
jgi:hypothetical protein